MGSYFCVAPCVGCGEAFTFNPHKVPSIRLTRSRVKQIPNPLGSGFVTAIESYTGDREPICGNCWERRQKYRETNGLAREEISPEAYLPVEEDDNEV